MLNSNKIRVIQVLTTRPPNVSPGTENPVSGGIMASGGIVKNVTSVYNRAFPVSHSPDSLPSFRTQQSLGISRDFLGFDRH